jgi:hypothetical protein
VGRGAYAYHAERQQTRAAKPYTKWSPQPYMGYQGRGGSRGNYSIPPPYQQSQRNQPSQTVVLQGVTYLVCLSILPQDALLFPPFFFTLFLSFSPCLPLLNNSNED